MTAPIHDAFVVTLRCPYPVAQVLDRLETLVRAHGLTVFARIEFSRDADAAGLSMPPTAQLVFGSPSAGTPVMTAVPTAALELPLRVVAWTDPSGQCWLSFKEPRALVSAYGVPESLILPLEGIHALCQSAIGVPSDGDIGRTG